jgi:hypothetical protein
VCLIGEAWHTGWTRAGWLSRSINAGNSEVGGSWGHSLGHYPSITSAVIELRCYQLETVLRSIVPDPCDTDVCFSVTFNNHPSNEGSGVSEEVFLKYPCLFPAV